MVFNFDYPYLLLLIPVAAAFIMFMSRNSVRLERWRRRAVITLRIIVLVLLILCIAGFGMKRFSDSSTTIFVVDSSESAAKMKDTSESFIRDAIKNKTHSEKVGIINFGADSSVETAPSDKPGFTSIQTRVNSNFTNIEDALKVASSLIPSGDRKRIIVVSDGLENSGDSLKQARILKQQGITLDVFGIKSEEGSEVQVKSIGIPETLRLKEKFEITAKIESTVKTSAVIRVFSDKQLIGEKQVEIQKGSNNFAFTDTAEKEGLITYTVVVDPDLDTIVKNNTMSTFSYVGDAAHILVIQDEDQAASEIVKMMGNDVKVQVSRPETLPITADELQKYDAFIISNVSAEKFDDRFLTSLETVIKHQGKGLLVTGGENSFAPGGYYKTPLEKVLPVNMDIKPKEELPNLGLVLVIDKSGSMTEGQYGISKLELAKEAAIRSTEVLRKEDMIGVIAFDDAVQWAVKTQKLDDLEKIQDTIGTIRPGGGTQIIPSLEEAYQSLKNAKTKLKHIILLTDGIAELTGYDAVIEKLNKSGITLSTVAVGRESAAVLLKALADGGGGRFYATDEFTDIPKIFAKETFLAGKTYLNNRTFTPTLSNYSEILKNITAVPSLDGYVSTTPKNSSKVVFKSDRDDPILATWQYGLGRTAVWTSDTKGAWTSKWMQWENSSLFWKNLTSWIIQKQSRDGYSVKGSLINGSGVIELTLPSDTVIQGESVEAVIVSPSGAEEKISMEPASPGVFGGKFNGDETGVYIANINIKNGSEVVKNINAGISIPYSPEYDVTRKNSSRLLEKIAYEGGGRILKDGKDAFSKKLPPVVSVSDMTPILLPLIILLLLLDITIRRINIPLRKAVIVLGSVAETGMKYTVKPLSAGIKAISRKKERNESEQTPEKAVNELAGKNENVQKQTVPAPQPQQQTAPLKDRDSGAHVSSLLDKKKRRERS